MVQLVVDAADERDLYQQRLLRVWLRLRVRVRVRVRVVEGGGALDAALLNLGGAALARAWLGVGVRIRV